MNNLFEFAINQLNDFWGRMDGPNRKRLIVAGVILVVLIASASYFTTRKEYVVLYSNLDAKDAGEIVKKLDEMKVESKTEGGGTISVPKELESKLRMQLAAEGYPKSGMSSDATQTTLGFGATDIDKRKEAQRQLQNRLQSAIKTMNGVLDAVVTISMPEQDSFVLKDDKQPTTASVLLTLSDSSLAKKQIKGIEQLVAKSVVGLKPENISIVDSGSMNILNLQDNSDVGAIGTNFEMENQVRDRLQKQVINLLEPVYGRNNSIVSVNVRLNFNKKVSEVERFQPVLDDTGIPVSVNEIKEKVINGTTPAAGTNATSATDTNQTQYAITQNTGDNGSYDKTSKTVNYEVNRIKDQIQEAQGQIDALTLSVVINKGDMDAQTITEVQNLVSKAVGVTEGSVVVKGMAFNVNTQAQEDTKKAQEAAKAQLFNQQIMDILKYAGVGLFFLILMFMLYRIVSKIAQALKSNTIPEVAHLSPVASKIFEEVAEMSVEQKEHLEVKKKIDDLVDRKPEVAVQQIRTWLNDD